MKRLTKCLTGGVLLFILSFNALAQKGYIKAGDNAFKSREYFNAIEIYKKAYSANPQRQEKARITFQIAECYRMIGDIKDEEQWYNKAVKADYNDPVALLYLGDAQKQLGDCDAAVISYTEYQSKVPSDPRGTAGINSCNVAKRLKDSATRWVVTNMGQLNTKFLDFAMTYSDRRLDEFIFTSTRQGATGDKSDPELGQIYSDLYITKLDRNGKFSTPVPLPAPINSDANEGAATFDKTYRTMYFTRCNVIKNKGEHCHIYSADRRGNAWTDPVMLDFQVDTVTYGHPCLSPDGQTLFFSSNLTGGFGGLDIWVSHYDKKTRKFGQPINLGPTINTASDECYPFANVDGSLYFSSDGWPGMGGLDIFHATPMGTDKWGNPVNMGSGINLESDDFGIVFEGNKQRGYLSSNRAGGKGMDDIYSFVMPPLIFAIKGTVTDVDSHKPIPRATVRMVGSDGSDVTMKTDTGGNYIFGLNGNARYVNLNTSYILSATATDLHYLANDFRANETTVGKTESETMIADFQLKKPEDIHNMRFPEVVFDLDQATLRPESKDSLNYLVKLLNTNPTLAIELDAHTDQQGKLQHNMILSQARAQSCVDYLISQGIDSARLTAKGWGPTRLKISDAQIKAARTKAEKDSLYHINRRVVFQITSWAYVPKGHIMTKEDSLKMKAGQKTKVSGQEDTNNISAPMSLEEQQSLIPPSKGDKTPAKPNGGNPPSNNNNNATKPKQNH